MSHKRGVPKGTVSCGLNGPHCPRCGWPMQVREHRRIKARHRRQPYYHTRWYCCMTEGCPTTLVMPPEHRVWSVPVLAEAMERQAEFDFAGDVALQVLESMAEGKQGK
jgi:hypothetical protein